MRSQSLPSFATETHAGRNLWNPAVTGNSSVDNMMGREYAGELIALMKRKDIPFMLGHVVKAAIARGEYSSVEIGFFQAIAEHALHIPQLSRDELEAHMKVEGDRVDALYPADDDGFDGTPGARS